MTIASPPVPAPRRRWPRVLLIVSLTLNALLIGVVLRATWGLRAHFAMTAGGVEASLPAFVDTLPAERRQELRQAGQPDRPGMLRPLRMEVRRARMEANRAFLAEPFDKPAFIAAQTRLFEAEQRLRLAIQRMLPEIGERMTVQERRAYLNWRGHGLGPPGGGPPGGFRRGGGQGPGSQGPNGGPNPRGPGFDGGEPGPGGQGPRQR